MPTRSTKGIIDLVDKLRSDKEWITSRSHTYVDLEKRYNGLCNGLNGRSLVKILKDIGITCQIHSEPSSNVKNYELELIKQTMALLRAEVQGCRECIVQLKSEIHALTDAMGVSPIS